MHSSGGLARVRAIGGAARSGGGARLGRRSRGVVLTAAVAALAVPLGLTGPSAHAEDVKWVRASDPATVTADPLPTVQVNGIVWAQVLVGNTVYATGSFTKARPAGSPAGVNEVTRRNL